MQHISHDLTIVAPFQVGDLVRVHWPSHDDWYNGTILEIGSPQELKCGAVEHADLREQRQEMHSLGLHGFKKHLKDVHWTDSDGIGGLQAQHGDPGAVTQMPAGGPLRIYYPEESKYTDHDPNTWCIEKGAKKAAATKAATKEAAATKEGATTKEAAATKKAATKKAAAAKEAAKTAAAAAAAKKEEATKKAEAAKKEEEHHVKLDSVGLLWKVGNRVMYVTKRECIHEEQRWVRNRWEGQQWMQGCMLADEYAGREKWEVKRKQESMAHWKQWSRVESISTDWSAWGAWETQKAFNKLWLHVKGIQQKAFPMQIAENHYVQRFLSRQMEYRPKRQNGKVADCVYSLMLLMRNHIKNRRESTRNLEGTAMDAKEAAAKA